MKNIVKPIMALAIFVSASAALANENCNAQSNARLTAETAVTKLPVAKSITTKPVQSTKQNGIN
ncbi:MAG: hypothetical protein AAGB31_07730 [Bdellovibrio sp.]